MTFFSKAEILYNKSINKKINEADLDEIIAWPEENLSVLFACAEQVKRHFFKSNVEPCTLMNIKSGNCSEDCAFCSQSTHSNAEIAKYDLSKPDEIIKNFSAALEKKLDFCVVSSGRKLSTEEIKTVAKALKTVGAPCHASLGILTDEEFSIIKDAGVVCYNHNLETGRNYFDKICTTHTIDDRIATVKKAKKAGINVCCGGIFGIGESWSDRRDLCLELMSLDVDTVPINFFNPVPGTRAKPTAETPMEFLKIISMFRLALPDKTIKMCGGREYHLENLQPLVFLAGANGYISGGYLTTSGNGIDADEKMINALGLKKTFG
jgi:biotin synthase